MKIFVTGGAGYIGSTVASALLDAGHIPIILDSLVTGLLLRVYSKSSPKNNKFLFVKKEKISIRLTKFIDKKARLITVLAVNANLAMLRPSPYLVFPIPNLPTT